MKRPPARCGHLALVLSVLAVIATISACGAARVSPAATGTASTSGPATIGITPTSVGSVLTGPTGRTLYVLMDSQGKAVACTGACPAVWPPVIMASGAPMAGSGVTASLSTTAGSHGTPQLMVAGEVVHYYVGDTAAGDANGEGISSYGGIWYALQPSGRTLTPGSGGNPYGY